MSRIEDFGRDGGSAIKAMEPKLALFKGHVIAALGYDIPHVEVTRTQHTHTDEMQLIFFSMCIWVCSSVCLTFWFFGRDVENPIFSSGLFMKIL